MKGLCNTVKFSVSMGMDFRLDKCPKVILKEGIVTEAHSIDLDVGKKRLGN